MLSRGQTGALLLSLGVALGGFVSLWRYENAPGDPGRPPDLWPAGVSVPRAASGPTLVLALHPKCSCSDATLDEVQDLLREARGRVAVEALFFLPRGHGDEWAEGRLWRRARSMAGVDARLDRADDITERFHVSTSGHALLYDASGRLVFSGGLTGARGHVGDNAGLSALLALVKGERPARRSTFVFGCLITQAARRSGNGQG